MRPTIIAAIYTTSELSEHEKAFYDFANVIKYGSDELKNEISIYSLHEKAFHCVPLNLKTEYLYLKAVKSNGKILQWVPKI